MWNVVIPFALAAIAVMLPESMLSACLIVLVVFVIGAIVIKAAFIMWAITNIIIGIVSVEFLFLLIGVVGIVAVFYWHYRETKFIVKNSDLRKFVAVHWYGQVYHGIRPGEVIMYDHDDKGMIIFTEADVKFLTELLRVQYRHGIFDPPSIRCGDVSVYRSKVRGRQGRRVHFADESDHSDNSIIAQYDYSN